MVDVHHHVHHFERDCKRHRETLQDASDDEMVDVSPGMLDSSRVYGTNLLI